ncbi:choice-of-anchor D domain-containing protein [Marinobacter halophilus]|uniref:Choice-of-anchor D domain-containing protein n=1 Tax=Marinobacter halophilus TaxID=1323740 RepID=A0A2T1KBK6_9GAMM|nr:choice-of-anchor D domain-containing protein [Marinobacter halophilus]PSF07519.1 hypothetical protein C7H08_13825 [Marinobacter halophilus]GGC80227.1 hypothetical protein GCM10011362_30990 [Marinobacter halophilus]
MKLRNLNTSVRKIGPAIATAALMAGGASNASAEQVSIELAFECPFPLIGTQPIRAQISADIPSVATVGEPTPQFEVTAITVVNDNARTGLKLVGSETVEGTAISTNSVVTANRTLQQIVELSIPPTLIPDVSGEFNVPATGMAPAVLFTEDDIGQAEIRVGGLTLDLTSRTPNGAIAPAPIGEILTDCVQVAGQNNLLQTITVGGEIVETPRISVNREEVAFGNVQAGLNAQETVSVVNTGSAALGISNVVISGTDADTFLLDNQCGTLAPSESCDVNVTFAPSTDGTRSATLTIESTDADNPAVDVALTGRGVLAPTPEIGVNPETVDLGRIQLGQSASAEVTINNAGNETLLVDSIALEGTGAADFVQTNNCTTVAANASCTVELSYTANAVGVSNANLVIRSSDPESPEISIPVSAEAFEQAGSELELLLGLEGSTLIKASGGTLPLNGSIATLLDLAAGTFEADLAIDPTFGNFSIRVFFSRLNASANVEFVPAAVTTGTLINGKLTANSQLFVKVPKVAIKIFGLPLRVGGGSECMTREPVNIELASVDGTNFSPATGGTVSGVYDLPALENCGLLTRLLNQFLTGSGNTIELALTPEL